MFESLLTHIQSPCPNSYLTFTVAGECMQRNNLPTDLFRRTLPEGGNILINAIKKSPMSPYLIEVIRYLLQVRDYTQGLPYIDINSCDNEGKTAMSHLLENNGIAENEQY